MEKPWMADHELAEATALQLIEAQFPALSPVRVAPFGIGWDNVALLVNDTLVFRFPRRNIAVRLLEIEARVLPVLAPVLPLAIPVPAYVGRPSASFPAPFVGYRCLRGRTACRARLDADARVRAAEPLAGFLRALHDVPLEAARAAGLPEDELQRTAVVRRAGETRARLAELFERGVLQEDQIPWRLLDEAREPAPIPARVVHGDLYARHLLVDASGALAGVIDWGDVHAGHPGLDLALAYGFLPPHARARFFAAYGAVDASTHVFARFRALFSAVAIIAYGHDIGDVDLLAEGQVALRHLRGA